MIIFFFESCAVDWREIFDYHFRIMHINVRNWGFFIVIACVGIPLLYPRNWHLAVFLLAVYSYSCHASNLLRNFKQNYHKTLKIFVTNGKGVSRWWSLGTLDSPSRSKFNNNFSFLNFKSKN